MAKRKYTAGQVAGAYAAHKTAKAVNKVADVGAKAVVGATKAIAKAAGAKRMGPADFVRKKKKDTSRAAGSYAKTTSAQVGRKHAKDIGKSIEGMYPIGPVKKVMDWMGE